MIDPVDMERRAREAGLVLQRSDPLNCETPLSVLRAHRITPNGQFYVRNHFRIPRLDADSWHLTVDGMVERPLLLTLPELQNMPRETVTATLECAGNGRSLLKPAAPGEQWGLCAVSTAAWTGIRLSHVLERAGIKAGALEVVFRGADVGPAGNPDPSNEPIRFERSLSIDHALKSDALLADTMNGEPLPAEHGYPLRLIVPGWYGVASVKWLTEIMVTPLPFTGYFQTDCYLYEWPRDGTEIKEPVTQQRVRSLITDPGPDRQIARGELIVRGLAWSGVAPIAQVEVSIGGGTWAKARLLDEEQPYSWRRWELITPVTRPGRTVIRARATDLKDRVQPARPEWNRLGYGSNAIQEVAVRIT